MKESGEATTEHEEPLVLGVVLALIQVAVFFSFVYACAFKAPLLAQDTLGLGIPLSFIYGLSVIVCGFVLTVLYVLFSNRGGAR